MPGTDIHVPHEIVNDDVVTISAWHVKPGEKVAVGQPIVSIETSKSVFDINAETEGYLEVLCGDRLEVAVGSLLARIHTAPLGAACTQLAEAAGAAGPSLAPSPAPLEPAPASTAQPRLPGLVEPPGMGSAGEGSSQARCQFSTKAQRLMERERIDPAVFAGKGMVREADVLEYMKKSGQKPAETSAAMPSRRTDEPGDQPSRPKEETAETASAAIPREVPPASVRSAEDKLGLWHDLRTSARDRGRGTIWLVWNYAWKGWFLRNLVRWAPYGVPQYLHRLRGVKLGTGCFIDPTAIVETAYGENVTIGNDVRISAGAVIMTHIKAPHLLREQGLVPLVKQPVVLEDHCFIGVNVVVMPGVTVGQGAVVASGAVVLSHVPPFCLVAGNPAKVVKKLVAPPRAAD